MEFARHGNKIRALSKIIRKIGIVTLMTNLTTATGFVVLSFTNIDILREFGLVAGINIGVAFVISIVLIPAIFSYLPPPKSRHLRHLNFRFTAGVIDFFDKIIFNYRRYVYTVVIILVIVSIYGLTKVKALAFMVDDIPEKSQIKKDMRFFEANFKGVMPLEIVVDTGNKKGAFNLNNLKKIEELEYYLKEQKYISAPVSVLSFIKASRQAFYNNDPSQYALPNNQDKAFILRYLQKNKDDIGLMNSFVDSTGQRLRISLKMADIGSIKMDSLVNKNLTPKISEIFTGTNMSAKVTGTSPIFIKGNQYLIQNLISSMLIAFLVISLLMALLFGKFKMIVLSILPNILPLLITGGIMGYFGIPLKPSTGLIFSIVFGISVDDTIHYLAKYRQELKINHLKVYKSVGTSLKETGPSMIYTSIVLFFGFIIFAFSDFGGTVALGILTSITLICAMITNLIFLPSLLLTFDTGSRSTYFPPLIEHYDEFYGEHDDEDIDLDKIQLELKSETEF